MQATALQESDVRANSAQGKQNLNIFRRTDESLTFMTFRFINLSREAPPTLLLGTVLTMFLHAETFHGNLLEKQLPIAAASAGSRETQTGAKVEAIPPDRLSG